MIEVRDLCFKYKSNAPLILNQLTFSLEDGAILSILGKNGMGKTTFIRCLTADLKKYTGTIKVDNKEVRSLSVNELAQTIAVVASNNPCYQNLSVADFLVTGFATKLTSLRAPDRKQYEKACSVLEELGHTDLLNRSIFELSSGELQIVKIARAILQDPQIVIFDEPTSNLDIKNQLMVLNQISHLAERGYTVITTTHNPGQSIELGGHVLLMSGTSQVYGAAESVLTAENLCSVYGLDVDMEHGRHRTYASFQDNLRLHRLVY